MNSRLEEECDDATFSVSEARQSIPALCAAELEQSIKHTNDINMSKVVPEQSQTILTCPYEKIALIKSLFPTDRVTSTSSYTFDDSKIEKIQNRIDNLRATLEQIKKDKKTVMH